MRPVDEIDYPKDKDEWWALVDHHKDDLRSLVASYHPAIEMRHNHKITAQRAEAVCQDVRREIAAASEGSDPLALFDAALDQKDGPTMATLLSAAWWGAPESEAVRTEAFLVLCDLCSESYVLEE